MTEAPVLEATAVRISVWDILFREDRMTVYLLNGQFVTVPAANVTGFCALTSGDGIGPNDATEATIVIGTCETVFAVTYEPHDAGQRQRATEMPDLLERLMDHARVRSRLVCNRPCGNGITCGICSLPCCPADPTIPHLRHPAWEWDESEDYPPDLSWLPEPLVEWDH